MNAPPVELRHLRYFSAVAEELHFGRAAARLGLSQPPLSLQIRQLEEIVGARLFDRHSRRVALTDAGRALHEAARRLLRDVEATLIAVRQAGSGDVGELRVAFAPTLMLSPLAHVIRRYRARYPGIVSSCASCPRPNRPRPCSAATSTSPSCATRRRIRGCKSSRIAREALLIAVDRDHPLAARDRVPLSALADDPWVLFPRAIAPLLYEQVLLLCRKAGFTPRVVQESRETYTTVGLVGAGVGVTVVPAAVERMGWEGVVYKPIPKAFTQLGMAWAAGPVRPVVERFLSTARSAPHDEAHAAKTRVTRARRRASRPR